MKKIIYDFGANNGDDIPYYLLKSDLVVAVEANGSLCEEIEKRFPKELKEGRLIIENCVVTADLVGADVNFYMHNKNHVLSQYPEPSADIVKEFTKIVLPSKPVIDIINKYGEPYYIKIDIEHYDAFILRSLFNHDIRPPYISAEAHSLDILSILINEGHYDSFKLIDGRRLHINYNAHIVSCEESEVFISFPRHASGPFGNDIIGEWRNSSDFLPYLKAEGLGWKDIHATNSMTI